ncbi:hypothetical protein JCM9279_002576 [Rhodotorula babjevae]
MPRRCPERSPPRPYHAAAALALLASSTVSASFLTAPLDALRARAFLSTRAAVPNTKAAVTYSNASSSLPTVVDTTPAQGRYGHSAVYLPPPANELLLIGGQVGESDTAITNDVLRFRLASSLVWGADRPLSAIPDNPLKNSSLATGLPASAWGAAAVAAQGQAWLIGGVTADCDKDAIAHVLSTVPASSSSSSATAWAVPALSPRYPPRRRQASALAVANATTGGTDVWVLGGIADSWTCSTDTIGYAGVDRYDTVSGLVESMPWSAPGGVDPAEWEPPVSDYAAVVLEQGVGILVVGGQGSDGHLADMAEVFNFDVATRSWTQQSVVNLAPAPRMGHASVLLASGSILIHGGLSSAHNVLADLFLLSSSTSGWTWTQLVTSDHSEASPALAYHSATQIVGGTIVVAFGIDGATSAPSGDFWFLTVDEDAGTYTWTDSFGGNADAVAALEADAAATTTFAAKFSKKTFEVVANPKAQTSSAAVETVAPSLGAYGPPESEAPISAPGYTPSSSSRSSPRTTSSPSAAATAVSASDTNESPTPQSTIIGASLGAIGAVAAAGLLFFLVRRRAAQQGTRAPSSPVMGAASRTDGAAPPLVSQLMYTRRAQARNMSLGSTLSALSPRALDVDEGSPNMAGIGAAAAAGASPDPFNDAYRVSEVGQLERAGSAASGTSSTGGVVGAVFASVSGLVAPQQQQQRQQHGDKYTSPAPTLSAKRSLRRPTAPPASLPIPGTPAELIGMAITSDDGHDGLPYVASSASSAHSHGAAPAAVGAAAAAGASSWDPARSQRPFSAPPAPPASTSRDARVLDLDASPVPAILRPGTPLRVANPDPFADQ